MWISITSSHPGDLSAIASPILCSVCHYFSWLSGQYTCLKSLGQYALFHSSKLSVDKAVVSPGQGKLNNPHSWGVVACTCVMVNLRLTHSKVPRSVLQSDGSVPKFNSWLKTKTLGFVFMTGAGLPVIGAPFHKETQANWAETLPSHIYWTKPCVHVNFQSYVHQLKLQFLEFSGKLANGSDDPLEQDTDYCSWSVQCVYTFKAFFCRILKYGLICQDHSKLTFLVVFSSRPLLFFWIG